MPGERAGDRPHAQPPLFLGPTEFAVGLNGAPGSVEELNNIPVRTVNGAGGTGALMILIVFVLPQGIVPAIERWFGVRPGVTPELRAMIEADVRSAA